MFHGLKFMFDKSVFKFLLSTNGYSSLIHFMCPTTTHSFYVSNNNNKTEPLLFVKHSAINFGFMTISIKSVAVIKELRKILR